MTGIRPGYCTGPILYSVVRVCQNIPRLNTYVMDQQSTKYDTVPVLAVAYACSLIFFFLASLSGSISTLRPWTQTRLWSACSHTADVTAVAI